MNAHLPVVRPLLCYARRGATPMHQKNTGPGLRKTHIYTSFNNCGPNNSDQMELLRLDKGVCAQRRVGSRNQVRAGSAKSQAAGAGSRNRSTGLCSACGSCSTCQATLHGLLLRASRPEQLVIFFLNNWPVLSSRWALGQCARFLRQCRRLLVCHKIAHVPSGCAKSLNLQCTLVHGSAAGTARPKLS